MPEFLAVKKGLSPVLLESPINNPALGYFVGFWPNCAENRQNGVVGIL
jgi:hypothetical protein